jgi:hypothetical protein
MRRITTLEPGKSHPDWVEVTASVPLIHATRPWSPDSNPTASGKPGAVHSDYDAAGRVSRDLCPAGPFENAQPGQIVGRSTLSADGPPG